MRARRRRSCLRNHRTNVYGLTELTELTELTDVPKLAKPFLVHRRCRAST